MWLRAFLVSVLILAGAAALIVFENWEWPAAVLMVLLAAGIVVLAFPGIARGYFYPQEPMRKRSKVIVALVALVGAAAVALLVNWDLRAAVVMALLIASILLLVASGRVF